MIRTILIVVLAVGVAGTGVWGYQEHREKNAVLLNAENNYQRAFHELTYQVDMIHDKIGGTLAMNSNKSLSPALADVWRLTSEAQSDVGQLPITLLPFNKTEEFLNGIGDFTYKVAVRDLSNEPLNNEEYAQLENLYKQSADIQNELRKVQHLVLENNLRWMDVEMALAANDEAADNTIIDGFKTVEKTAEGYDEAAKGDPSAIALSNDQNNGYQNLSGEPISKEEAVKIAKSYISKDKVKEVKVTQNGEGSDVGFYSVSITHGKDAEANMDITKKGGYPIYLLDTRDISDTKLSLNQASEKAKEFMKEHGFQDLEMFESTQYDNMALFNYVSVRDGVRVYPDMVKVKVALDNGDIVGFTADEYLQNHKEREIPKPALTLEQARSYIHSNVKIMDERLAIIQNELGEDVLCYEFMGQMNDDTYRVYINAETGQEESVEKLQNAEPIYDDLV